MRFTAAIEILFFYLLHERRTRRPPWGERAQEIINRQLVKDSDLLVAIFWTRIGTPTEDAASGTVEEIEEHIKAGKP